MILKIKNLKKEFGTKVLFENAQIIVQEGDRIVLVGQNGTGKTTFIKCITGEEDFEGLIEITPDIKISVMEQEKEFDKSEQTYSDYLKGKLEKIENLKKECEEKMGDPLIIEDVVKFGEVLTKYELLCSRIVEKIEESKIKKILGELKFEMEDYGKRIIDLSGGQRTKLRLAECLSKDATFLLLDEPTNHLDFDTLRWLEEYLLKSNKTLLMVSHDRYFLNKVVNRVVEIENKTFQEYNCGYERYLEDREKHLDELKHQYKVVKKEKDRLLASAREKRRWASISGDRRFKIKADNLERQAENLPKLTNPQEFTEVFKLNFEKGIRIGTVVFTLKDVKKAFGDLTVFDKVSLEINNGDKIAIIGGNGSGKSTLLKLLNSLIQPTEGSIKGAYNLKIGYFDQEFKNMDMNQKVIDFFRELSPKSQEHDIIAQAIKFGFPKDKFKNKLKTLSGGEKARLNFVRLMSRKFNVLLLDEPTNNLDVELIKVLEESLKGYKGTVIFVSHDRYFINQIATKVIDIDAQNIEIYNGNYSDTFD